MNKLKSWVPYAFQKEGVKLGISQACAGFLLRPGMGKTTIVYAIVKILKAKELIRRTLVLVPIKPMYNVWPHQCHDWKEFDDLDVVVCHGRDRVKTLLELDHDIYCINYEGLEWLCEDPTLLAHLKANFDVLVCDESTRLKNTSTQRFKRVRKFVKYFRRRYILTGSFTPNGLLDLFGQIFVLDEGASLGSYVTHYRTKYFYATDFMGFNLAPHPWAAPEIAQKIAPLTLVMEREGNITMPELLPCHDIVVDLPASVQKQYDATYDNMLTMLESGDLIISKNAAVATSKCRQIANGFIFHDRDTAPGEWTDLHSCKIEALKDLIDELSGEPLLVCYEFKPDLEKLQAAFPEARLLTSGNAKKDDDAISVFKAGMIRVGLAQITSISLGIDGLQNSCSNICMYAITWNLQDYSQAIDRVWRPGQKAKYVSVHRIITKDTVDERVLKVLGNKEAVQTDFLGLLKEARA